jgi:hypothetical protein
MNLTDKKYQKGLERQVLLDSFYFRRLRSGYAVDEFELSLVGRKLNYIIDVATAGMAPVEAKLTEHKAYLSGRYR